MATFAGAAEAVLKLIEDLLALLTSSWTIINSN